MFLATTASKEFWSKEDNLLFLGPWCLHDYFRAGLDLEDINGIMMPSPWLDRHRFYEFATKADSCYELLLIRVVDYLNEIHGVNYSQKYWRTLVGGWLYHFTHITLDRYICLRHAFSKYPDLQTILVDGEGFSPPWDINDFIEASYGDAYNLKIYSDILRIIGYKFPSKKLQTVSTLFSSDQNNGLSDLKYEFSSSEEFSKNSQSSEIFPHIAFCDFWSDSLMLSQLLESTHPYSSILNFSNLQFSFLTKKVEIDTKYRSGLFNLDYSGDLGSILLNMLPMYFPKIYLEGYQLAKQEVLKRFPKIPSTLVTITSWHTTEPFKFLAAEATELGGRLVIHQHGGLCHRKSSPAISHELEIADSYYSWGWTDKKSGKCRPLTNFKVTTLINELSQKNGLKNSLDGKVLLVSSEMPRYLLRFASAPVGCQILESWEDMDLFLSTVKDKEEILWRPKTGNFSLYPQKLVAQKFPKIQIENHASCPLHKRILKSRLVVVVGFSTVAFEALALNIPTLIFTRSTHYELESNAEFDFKMLQNAGILWNDPILAARHFNNICKEPSLWWDNWEVQKVRDEFTFQYARTHQLWLKDWTNALKEDFILSIISTNSMKMVDKKSVTSIYQSIKSNPYLQDSYKDLACLLYREGKPREAYKAYSLGATLKSI
ncbi:LIC12162 family protein [Phormidium yuhuli AB48]|uniref:LIC12162 family protein n=1 Tax=Phormidium yuhuli AB48 TaxID=2940671 RepID=A0ABY5ANW7_9CYAN|nr:LIC12162 family protein [Phormidium yuhuli]USR89934.1 LIC12162 family protein [Phormidium yuhuli AB48]